MNEKLENKVIVLLGHGSSRESSNRDFENFLQAYSERWPRLTILHGYIEAAKPSMEEALKEGARIAQKEKKGLLLAPLLLFEGAHFQRDIPFALQKLKQEYPKIELYLSNVMGAHPNLARLAYKRACQTGLLKGPKPEKIILLYLGRGSKSKKSREDFERQLSLFTKGKGFAKSIPCFAGMQEPSLKESLQMSLEFSKREGFHQILLVPHLLFFGSLLEKVQKEIRDFQTENPRYRIELAQSLGAEADELLFSVLDERILEVKRC